MKNVINVVFILIFLPTLSYSNDFCERQTNIDPEVPAGITGLYDIVGRAPGNGIPYTGEVKIGISETSYTLQRTLKNETVTGQMWIEFCGADRMRHLFIVYETKPLKTELFCSAGNDGDNYYRITCKSRNEHIEDQELGLEALFQQH